MNESTPDEAAIQPIETEIIADRSVFILGAGASKPFQYPLGKSLVDEVIAFNPDDVSGLQRATLDPFKQALWQSAVNSVDLFLERNANYMKIGRLAIANVLINHEVSHRLWENTSGRERQPVDSWYKYLFNQLVAEVPFEGISSWPIAFITFNYDRSLEHFFFEATKNFYGKSESETAAALKEIPFLHVHGHLGLLPWQAGEGPKREYGTNRTTEGVNVAAHETKILHEADESSPDFEKARNLLRYAARIYVLGFGYHPANVKRLNLVEGATHVGPLGTSVGLTPEEQQAIRRRCNIAFPASGRGGIVEFLRGNIAFLETKWG
jgi:hypothetical protein